MHLGFATYTFLEEANNPFLHFQDSQFLGQVVALVCVMLRISQRLAGKALCYELRLHKKGVNFGLRKFEFEAKNNLTNLRK